MVEYTSEWKSNKHSGESESPEEFIEIWKDVSLRQILKDKCYTTVYQFVNSNLGVEISLKYGIEVTLHTCIRVSTLIQSLPAL